MRNAFSLVELSIVLVILGLLTGGILTGQNLIRAAELRSITAEHSRHLSAIYTFRDKYFALPGDMTNATDFWGASSACSGSVATGTCNGDGDGRVEDTSLTTDGTKEYLQSMNQLALAGLIEGTYTGVMSGDMHAGVGLPPSKASNMLWTFRQNPATYGLANGQRNILEVSALRNGYSPIIFGGGGLTAEEAWNIDTKMDDGLASAGKVFGVRDSSAAVRDVANSCVTNKWDQSDADYVLTDTVKNCRLMFFQ